MFRIAFLKYSQCGSSGSVGNLLGSKTSLIYSLNFNKGSFFGLIIGIIIGIAIAVIKELRDTTVKDTDFLTKELGLTNLGAIYHISSDNQDYGLVKIFEKNESVPENGDERRVRRRV